MSITLEAAATGKDADGDKDGDEDGKKKKRQISPLAPSDPTRHPPVGCRVFHVQFLFQKITKNLPHYLPFYHYRHAIM